MTAHALKPNFHDLASYRRWRAEWRSIYKEMSARIRRQKLHLKSLQRAGAAEQAAKAQQRLVIERAVAHKFNTLRNEEAKGLWARIQKMESDLAAQRASFPIVLPNCPTIDMHFNKGHLQFPQLPMWVVKAKGTAYYVDHIDAKAFWSTRENPDHASTKGSLRFRRCDLTLNPDGSATISDP